MFFVWGVASAVNAVSPRIGFEIPMHSIVRFNVIGTCLLGVARDLKDLKLHTSLTESPEQVSRAEVS